MTVPTNQDISPVAVSSPPVHLAQGIELIGEYEGSGYAEPRYLVKRADGQMVALSLLLYLVVQNVAACSDVSEVAARVSAQYGRGVSPENIDYLVDKRLQPLGVAAVGAAPPSPVRDDRSDLLRLSLRTSMVPPRLVNSVAAILRHLFHPPVVLAVLVSIVLADGWFIGHGVGAGVRGLLQEPLWILVLFATIFASAVFHESGHASACRYSGGTPGSIGMGLYLVWPAFYTDVTDSYRLSRAGRVRTDLGGIYFNVIFALGTFGVYAVTGWEPLLVVVLVQHFEILHQFTPVIRLDGYYVVSDLAGVPDLFRHVGPAAKRLLRREQTGSTFHNLRPRAQRIICLWLVFSAPVLAFGGWQLVTNTPRVLSSSLSSLQQQAQQFDHAMGAGSWVLVALALLSIVLLVLPPTGIVLIYVKLAQSLYRTSVSWAEKASSLPRWPLVTSAWLTVVMLLGRLWHVPSGVW